MRNSSSASSRHGTPRPGVRAFCVVHDHEYWLWKTLKNATQSFGPLLQVFALDEVYHTYAALLEVNCISPHQVLLERKIDDFSHKNAGDAIAAVAARFPLSVDASADSDLDASR